MPAAAAITGIEAVLSAEVMTLPRVGRNRESRGRGVCPARARANDAPVAVMAVVMISRFTVW